jgi:hypothetical protein
MSYSRTTEKLFIEIKTDHILKRINSIFLFELLSQNTATFGYLWILTSDCKLPGFYGYEIKYMESAINI